MRPIGSLHPTDQITAPPDSVITLSVENSSGQASSWFGSTTNAGAAGVHIARLTGVTSGGAQLNFHVNLFTTHAAVPSAGTSTQGSTGFQHPVLGRESFLIPGGSTGFSVASLSSGHIMVEGWKIGG